MIQLPVLILMQQMLGQWLAVWPRYHFKPGWLLWGARRISFCCPHISSPHCPQVFTTIDVVSLVFSVLATNLCVDTASVMFDVTFACCRLSIDGKTNYFKGACLMGTYVCILVVNFYNSQLDALDQSNRV
jgi:hypothetical protein